MDRDQGRVVVTGMGLVTPVGGVLMITAWLALAWRLFRTTPQR